MNYVRGYGCLLILGSVGCGMLFAGSPMLFSGTIQFPHNIKSVPSLFIFSQGSRIQGSPDDLSHTFNYAINRPRTVQRFHIVITEHLLFDKAELNTIQCWRVDTTKPYKFYSFTRVLDQTAAKNNAENAQPQVRWEIQLHDLTPYGGRLPDDAIIIYYDATLVGSVRADNPFEWPTIVIKPDILATLGSEESLHDLSEKIMLAAMDIRLFFCPSEHVMKHNAQVRTIVALTIS